MLMCCLYEKKDDKTKWMTKCGEAPCPGPDDGWKKLSEWEVENKDQCKTPERIPNPTLALDATNSLIREELHAVHTLLAELQSRIAALTRLI